MKKLFLTLFAVAAIVACQKEAVESQEPLAIEIEEVNVNMDIDTDLIIESITARFGAEGFEATKAPSSSRTTGPAVSCAEDVRDGLTIGGFTDYISYEITTVAAGNFGVVRNEEESLSSAFTPIVTLYFVNEGSNVSGIYVLQSDGSIDRVGEFTSVGFNGLYSNTAGINGLYIENLNARFGYTSVGNAASAGLECVNTRAHYDVTPAPFPLNGFLATISSSASFTGSSLNFAGTDEAAVRRAIEADILDGN